MFRPSEDANASNRVPAENSEGEPRREQMRHLLYGSLEGIDRTIKLLHKRGYAEPHEWSEPIPTERANEWMVILTKLLLIL